MIVYLVAAIEILLYLCAVPLHIAVCFQAGDSFSTSAAFSFFEGRFAKRRAFMRLERAEKKPPDAHKGISMPRKVRLILHILRHMDSISIKIHGNVSTSDAAATALICGCARSVEYALRPFFPGLMLDIFPDFTGEKFRTELYGMISLRSGQIIRAALKGALKNANRRITQWISIQSKAS
ncbi:MAG: hypothetical protein IKM02_04680 [Clostridia bacterium]|nr:hypothetical protein [Clostridia bacterium]